MDRLVCQRKDRSVDSEQKVTPFGYWIPTVVVWYIVEYLPCSDHLSYTLVKQIDFSAECTGTEMWTADWRLNMQATFVILLEWLFLVWFSLCLGELECWREYVGEIMSERSYLKEHARENISERLCQRDCVREIVSERLCQRDCVREIVSERLCQRDCVREIVSERTCQRACQGACRRVCQGASESDCWSDYLRKRIRDSVSELVMCQECQLQCWPDLSRD